MSRIKYMGAADLRRFEKGEDFGGRMAEPLPRHVDFSWSNHHTIDTSDEENADLPKAFWALLAVEPGFQDISNEEIAPVNDAEKLWKSMRNPNDPSHRGMLEGSEVPGRPEGYESVSSMGQFPTVVTDEHLNDPPQVPRS